MACKRLSIALYSGECLALVGAPAAGLSTVLRLLSRVEHPQYGSVDRSAPRDGVSVLLGHAMVKSLYRLYLGIADGMPIARVRACWYSK